ncbi:MAG: hypothetical protein WC397_03255 [Candidatus Paceibacterota bacterium]
MINFNPDRIAALLGEHINPAFSIPPNFFFGARIIAEVIEIPLDPSLNLRMISCFYF